VSAYAPPTITSLANQSLITGASSAALAFTVGDSVTPAAALTVTGISSNVGLIPNANIVLAGAGAARTVTITSLAGKGGTATITLTVKDGGNLTVATSFLVQVYAAPTISAVANQTTTAGTPTSTAFFTVYDLVTPAASLTVAASSGDTTLAPVTAIVVTGPTANGLCSVTVTPPAGQSGTVSITLMVTDGGGLTAFTSYTVTVQAKRAPRP
jgi:hypothetical protein